MNKCEICNSTFETCDDSVVLCKHHGGFVHLGCCLERCSWNKALCIHSLAVYTKQQKRL